MKFNIQFMVLPPSEGSLCGSKRFRTLSLVIQSFPLPAVGGTGTTPEERKKKYAEDLRRQMDEQRKAKLKEREEYHASPSQKKKNEPDKFLTKQR